MSMSKASLLTKFSNMLDEYKGDEVDTVYISLISPGSETNNAFAYGTKSNLITMMEASKHRLVTDLINNK